MALENENGSMVMPVAPMYGGGYGNMNNGGFGFGGDGLWFLILFFLLAGNGGWGGWGMNGMGGFAADGAALYPWMNQSNQINNGFRDQMINDNVTSIRDGIHGLSTQLCNCCGDMQMALANGFSGVQQSLCNGFAGTTAAVTAAQNGITQQLYNNEIASLNRSFAEQTANTAGFTGVNSGIADLRYTEATENCATRTAAYQNTRDIIDSQTRGTQAILDKLCALELDNVKAQVAAEQRENANLRSELMYSRGQASQIDQTAQIRASQATTANQIVSELRSCPIPAYPVYGNQPIFQCAGPTFANGVGNGCGCGCNM